MWKRRAFLTIRREKNEESDPKIALELSVSFDETMAAREAAADDPPFSSPSYLRNEASEDTQSSSRC